MTDYKEETLRCFCCGKKSKQTVLLSTNSFRPPDLDQRQGGMARSTISYWLLECPFCGYVAPDIEQGDAKAKSFMQTPEFQAASSDPTFDPAARRFLVRAAEHAHDGDRMAAFLDTLSAAWIADDSKQPDQAAVLRLKAAARLAGSGIKSINTRLVLLDVLRRASCWDAAEALVDEMLAEDLEDPFVGIVLFHRGKITKRDSGRYTIADAQRRRRGASTVDPEMMNLLAGHLSTPPSSRQK
ncbi:hypothetical protein [Bradyrhizobium sp. MOS003]|uniref:hypothetical protein n=1 Tax=Bradyrhizobium sp. MOS003 TaxID=2133946 RepID=UPI000D1269AA|nr:hypothetical protein [Bradyrhizobium sp. MOS003]PSO19485.1 hypothetical protein C7G42_14605 [Bradyrhizobium sp. MOS003]